MARHRLVTIGDSITQGVRSGAIVDGLLSWPAFLASALGVDGSFRSPVIAEPRFGLPTNLEYLVEEILARYGSTLNWYEIPQASLRIRAWMDDLEDHWEDGPGAQRRGPDTAIGGGPYHNLGILGFDLRDALSLTAEECDRRIPERRRSDDFVQQVPEQAGLRVARTVLAASGPTATVFDSAKALADDGGVEVLVVMLGANNALQVASELELFWTGHDFDDLDGKGKYTLWRPEHFAAEYDLIIDAAAAVGAEHTVLATVPKVTIAPIARGLGGKIADGSLYFRHYTRPWIDDDNFDPRRDPHITARDASDTDTAIDAYNDHIRRRVAERGDRWHVFELAALLDSMATRRFIDDASARPIDFVPYRWPPLLDRLEPQLGTRFYRSQNARRVDGGIFSLDGIHPTAIASAVLAHEIGRLLRDVGVADVGDVDLSDALEKDRLNNPDGDSPADIVDSALGIIGWLDQTTDIFTSITRFGR